MIGPHEGKELELMLAGRKKLAMFFDYLPHDGIIPEEIIPEKAFAPYVENGTLVRFARDIKNVKTGDIIRNVMFTTRGDEWRAQTMIWIKSEIFECGKKFDEAHDIIIGRLLGYNEDDITEFLNHQSRRRTA